MNAHPFDALTRTMMTRATRRRVVGFTAAGLSGTLLAVVGRATLSRAAPDECSIGCAGLSGPQKAACKHACRQCANGFDDLCPQPGPFGPTGFICCDASVGLICTRETGEYN